MVSGEKTRLFENVICQFYDSLLLTSQKPATTENETEICELRLNNIHTIFVTIARL